MLCTNARVSAYPHTNKGQFRFFPPQQPRNGKIQQKLLPQSMRSSSWMKIQCISISKARCRQFYRSVYWLGSSHAAIAAPARMDFNSGVSFFIERRLVAGCSSFGAPLRVFPPLTRKHYLIMLSGSWPSWFPNCRLCFSCDGSGRRFCSRSRAI